MPKIEPRADSSFLLESLDDYATIRKDWDSHAKGLAEQTPIHLEYLAALLNEFGSDNAIFTCDTGMSTVWAARYPRMTRDRRLLGSFNHGSMANAMPHAIGAQFAQPGRQVVALCGDGGFSMLLGDILTIRQYELPIKLIIFNNSCLGMVKLEMQVAGRRLLHDLLFLLTHGNFYRSHAGVSSKVAMSKIGHRGVPYWADVGMVSTYKYRRQIQ
jgi:pyruvate dehydrogenase (quinone)